MAIPRRQVFKVGHSALAAGYILCGCSTGTVHSGKVIVVGAGFAGLAAARKLKDEGFEVLELEARDRPGGRDWTSRLWQDAPMDLGGSWTMASMAISLPTSQRPPGLGGCLRMKSRHTLSAGSQSFGRGLRLPGRGDGEAGRAGPGRRRRRAGAESFCRGGAPGLELRRRRPGSLDAEAG
jgi:choline dehydrogenase-like flavoprotein